MKSLFLLTLEVGSTMTKANGFVKSQTESLVHVAQGFYPTSIEQGDVSIGVDGAIASLELSSGYSATGAEIFINSSAAGGLKMTVHGLTLSMTARAAKEASLGAGAIIRKLTAGALQSFDLEEIQDIAPNLILLAGGVDFGDSVTVLNNARQILSASYIAPVVYAGNVALQKPIAAMAKQYGRELWIADNVFPAVDVLNIEPLRKIIHDAFARHIIHAPGMQKLSKYTTAPVLPTPGAVLLATKMFAKIAGDSVVIDVGGATTDVHSVTDGSKQFAAYLTDPEPREKRTVEGDLGVFVNAEQVLAFDMDGKWKNKISHLSAMPQTPDQIELTKWLCETAVIQAIKRHAGSLTDLFTATGRKQVVRGKDLTAVEWIIGTGGALTRVEGGHEILKSICTGAGNYLLPSPGAKIILDKNYLFSALGTISQKYATLVENTMRELYLL